MNSKRPFLLTFCILISSLLFTIVGIYWNQKYYHEDNTFSIKDPPLAQAMMGLHDGLLSKELIPEATDESALLAHNDANSKETIEGTTITNEVCESEQAQMFEESGDTETTIEESSTALASRATPKTYSFTSVTDEYFNDAVFIGDSRTVGICEFSGIENATFLCKTSLSIYDYTKPKITYNDEKTSIQEVLKKEKFGKVYLMVGINECGYGTAESFYENYREVVEDIRELQPDALIFIESNLLVTESKSESNSGITNENITSRNDLIATLANQQDTFYIDINQSSLCENGALIPDLTWDQIHIKAQYYEVWKEFLLDHGIVKNADKNI